MIGGTEGVLIGTVNAVFNSEFHRTMSDIAAAIGQASDVVSSAFEILGSAFEILAGIMDTKNFDDFSGLQDQIDFVFEPRKEDGFVCVNEATDTWQVRALYETRQREWLKMVRQAQRIPPKRIRQDEKYRQQKRMPIR